MSEESLKHKFVREIYAAGRPYPAYAQINALTRIRLQMECGFPPPDPPDGDPPPPPTDMQFFGVRLMQHESVPDGELRLCW